MFQRVGLYEYFVWAKPVDHGGRVNILELDVANSSVTANKNAADNYSSIIVVLVCIGCIKKPWNYIWRRGNHSLESPQNSKCTSSLVGISTCVTIGWWPAQLITPWWPLRLLTPHSIRNCTQTSLKDSRQCWHKKKWSKGLIPLWFESLSHLHKPTLSSAQLQACNCFWFSSQKPLSSLQTWPTQNKLSLQMNLFLWTKRTSKNSLQFQWLQM